MHETMEQLRLELCEAVAGMTFAEAEKRPGSGRWSVRQVMEHLMLSYATTCEVMMTRVRKGTPTKASPSMQQRFGQMMIAGFGVFPKGRSAPAAVTPQENAPSAMDGLALGVAVGQELEKMDRALAAAAGMFGESRRAVSHLVLGPMSVGQWRRFHLVHGRHHMKQIAAIRGLESR